MIFTGKQTCNFIKKKLQRICFPVNIAKLFRVPILKSICERLLPLSKKYVVEYKKLIHGCFGIQRLYVVGTQLQYLPGFPKNPDLHLYQNRTPLWVISCRFCGMGTSKQVFYRTIPNGCIYKNGTKLVRLKKFCHECFCHICIGASF